MKTALALIGGVMMAAASPAFAQTTYDFKTVGNTADDGKYGNSLTFDTVKPSTLQVKATAWQKNTSTGAITSAYLGAYSGGLGVTGINDIGGDYNLHQIDNNNGYVDFVMLQFSKAVTLSQIGTNVFGLNDTADGEPYPWYYFTPTPTVSDDDWAFSNAGAVSIPGKAWNSEINLATSKTALSWTNLDGSKSTTGATALSSIWLVGASFTQGGLYGNDGFKLASITATTPATPAVPEPASWAMMLVGFGTLGSVMRRKRQQPAVATA